MSNQLTNTIYSILIIEPNANLASPYQFLNQNSYQLTKAASLELALSQLKNKLPNLIALSTSFSANKTLYFLESVKNLCTKQLIPLVFVVDLNQPVSQILGTHWADKLAILHSASSKQETLASVERLLSA